MLTKGHRYSQMGSKLEHYTSRLYLRRYPTLKSTPGKLLRKYITNGKSLQSIIQSCACMFIRLYDYWFGFFSARRQGLTPDNEVVEKHIADLSAKLDVYDKILGKQKYLAGDVRLSFWLITQTYHVTFPFF